MKGLKKLKRMLYGGVGIVLIVIGIALLFLPGPGWIFIGGGILLLGRRKSLYKWLGKHKNN